VRFIWVRQVEKNDQTNPLRPYFYFKSLLNQCIYLRFEIGHNNFSKTSDKFGFTVCLKFRRRLIFHFLPFVFFEIYELKKLFFRYC